MILLADALAATTSTPMRGRSLSYVVFASLINLLRASADYQRQERILNRLIDEGMI
jgi:hypothetical protein